MAKDPQAPKSAPASTASGLKRYRLKAGAKLNSKIRGEDGRLIVYTEGDVVELTENQARAFHDRIEPA